MRVNDAYPLETCEITGRFDAGYVGEFDETVGRYANAETPLVGFAGFEVGESFVAEEIHEDIGGMIVFVGADAGQLLAEIFQLRGVHRNIFTPDFCLNPRVPCLHRQHESSRGVEIRDR